MEDHCSPNPLAPHAAGSKLAPHDPGNSIAEQHPTQWELLMCSITLLATDPPPGAMLLATEYGQAMAIKYPASGYSVEQLVYDPT